MKKDILSLLDLEKDDFLHLFERAADLKKRYKKGISDKILSGKTLGLIFDKKSTRTRVAFESAIIQLGGTPIFMAAKDTQISRNEPIKDTARVLSRFIDALAIRTFAHDIVEGFAESSSIPVINALTDLYHPCQILSDLLTVMEFKGGYENLKIAWAGDGNNVCHSWINATAVLGLDFIAACPEGYFPDPKIVETAEKRGGKKIQIVDDPVAAVKDADVVYTDVWASMGQESEQAGREKVFEPFQVNGELMSHAAKDAIVLHCLPAHRGEEISEEVLEGRQSVVWDQAENKMHMHKAILETLMLQPQS